MRFLTGAGGSLYKWRCGRAACFGSIRTFPYTTSDIPPREALVPKIEAAIREAVLRGARREVRTATGSLRRDIQRLRQHVRLLRQTVKPLRDVASQWQRASQVDGWKPQVSEQELKTSRLSSRLIRKLRTRLGLSQANLARLLKVSNVSVLSWEHGRTKPAGQNRTALVALRKLGRRDVKRLLSALPKPAARSGRSGRRRKQTRRAGATRKPALKRRGSRSRQHSRSRR